MLGDEITKEITVTALVLLGKDRGVTATVNLTKCPQDWLVLQGYLGMDEWITSCDLCGNCGCILSLISTRLSFQEGTRVRTMLSTLPDSVDSVDYKSRLPTGQGSFDRC